MQNNERNKDERKRKLEKHVLAAICTTCDFVVSKERYFPLFLSLFVPSTKQALGLCV
jgi:hypothetical protein